MPQALLFERTMMQFFGDKAYGIAGMAYNKKARKEWLSKAIKKILLDINELDSSLYHKQTMLKTAERLQKEIEKNNEPDWNLIYNFMRLCGQLLGLYYVAGKPCKLTTPIYTQDENQYFTELMANNKHNDFLLDKEKKDAISVRAKIAQKLKKDGMSTFKISLVLNISEYKVKQLLKFANES